MQAKRTRWAKVKNASTVSDKPKDAIALILQEVQLDARDRPDVVEEAKAEAQDLLRRMREGII